MIGKEISALSALLLLSAPAFAADLPRDVPRHAAEAMVLAQKWQHDAILIAVDTQSGNDYALQFDFRSASTRNRFSATFANGKMTAAVQPPVSANDGGALPLNFLDLPAAVTQAKQRGLSSPVKEAMLGISGGRATWSLEADTDHPPYEFTIDAALGAPPPMIMAAKVTGTAAATPSPALPPLPVHVVTPSAAADALWQKGSAAYDRNDYRSALALYQQAAQAGHPRAMAVLGTMYREGQGVPKNAAQAVSWYTQAATAGNRGAQYSLGSMVEYGEGTPKNLARAVQLYEASARQGMPEAQMALGMDYELGQGVPRNRQTAIFWLNEAAKQGDGRAQWIAQWLRRPGTPQFANETQLGRYIDGQVGAHYASQIHPAAGPVGGGPSASERNYRAADAESRGDYDRAGSCRGGGACP